MTKEPEHKVNLNALAVAVFIVWVPIVVLLFGVKHTIDTGEAELEQYIKRNAYLRHETEVEVNKAAEYYQQFKETKDGCELRESSVEDKTSCGTRTKEVSGVHK